MPGGDLVLPADQRATERSSLDRVVRVVEIGSEALGPFDVEVGILVRVQLSNCFLRVPHGRHVPLGVSGAQQAEQLLPAVVGETFVGLGEEPPASVERIGLVTSVAHGLVLYPASAFVELGVGQLDHVKWIGHLGDIGNHGRERLAIGTGEVERGVADLVPPWLPLFGQPSHGTCAAATRDDVEELTTTDVDDLGGELLAVPFADPGEEHLIEAQGRNRPEALRVVVDQGGAIGDDRVVDRVPVTPEFDGDLVHAAGVAPDLFGGPPASPVAHRHARSTDAQLLCDPGPRGACLFRALPPVVAGTGDLEQPGHAGHLEVRALRGHQCKSLCFGGFEAKYAAAFPRKARSLSYSATWRRSRSSSARSAAVNGSSDEPATVSIRRRSSRTHLAKELSTTDSSAATSCNDLPVSITR